MTDLNPHAYSNEIAQDKENLNDNKEDPTSSGLHKLDTVYLRSSVSHTAESKILGEEDSLLQRTSSCPNLQVSLLY